MAYIGKIPATGNFVKLDAISVVNGQAGYTMQSGSANFTPESANHMLVSLNGVIQSPSTSFTVSGSTITFASNLVTGDVIDFIMVYGNVLDIGTPSDDTVSTAKLQANAVTTAKITDANITTAKIANDAVDKDKVNLISTSSSAGLEVKGDGTSDGYLQLNCSQNSHGIKLKSPPHSASASYTLTFPNNDGNADQVLTTNGSGVLSFADAGGGTHVLLSTTTVSSGVANVDITSNIDSTYKRYMFDVIGMKCTDDQNINIRVFNSSIETASVYCQFSVDGNQTSSSVGGVATQDTGVGITLGLSVGGASVEHLNSRVFLNNPSETTFHKLIEFSSTYQDSSANSSYTAGFGSCKDPQAITGIRFYPSSGTISAGVIKLYGIT